VLNVNQEKYVTMRAKSRIGNQALKTLIYAGSKTSVPKKDYWPGKKMRCYEYFVNIKALSKVKATVARSFFRPGNKLTIKVRIGANSGKIRLNI
jgi:hypothetical protein